MKRLEDWHGFICSVSCSASAYIFFCLFFSFFFSLIISRTAGKCIELGSYKTELISYSKVAYQVQNDILISILLFSQVPSSSIAHIHYTRPWFQVTFYCHCWVFPSLFLAGMTARKKFLCFWMIAHRTVWPADHAEFSVVVLTEKCNALLSLLNLLYCWRIKAWSGLNVLQKQTVTQYE